MFARLGVALLVFALLGAECDEHPDLDKAFELLDAVEPASYRQVDETIDQAVAIRTYSVPASLVDPDQLTVPDSYKRVSTEGLENYEDLNGVEVLESWFGPSLSGERGCTLDYEVIVRGGEKKRLVRLVAGCALKPP